METDSFELACLVAVSFEGVRLTLVDLLSGPPHRSQVGRFSDQQWGDPRDRGHARDRRIDVALSALFVVLTVVLGGIRLSRHVGMWRDEAATAGVVSGPFTDMWSVINRREAGMGPYYVALWLWTRLGHSDVWIRSFSVLGSAVAVLLVFRLTLKWFSRWPAVVAATILMVSPFMHRYQTEARTYAWTMAVAVGMAFLGDLWVRRPSTVCSLGLGALTGVGVALSPLFVLWVGSFAVVVLLAGGRVRTRQRGVALVALAAVVCAAPFVPSLLRTSDQLDWIPKPTIRDAIVRTTTLLGGGLFALGLLAGGSALVVALISHPLRWRELRFSAPLLLGYAPIVLLAIVSWAIKPLFNARYLTPSAPFIAIAAVAGWTTLRMRVQQVALVGTVVLALVVFAGSGPHLDSDRAEDLKVAARQLSEQMQPGDVVVFEPAWMRMPLARYWRPGPDVDVAKPVPDLGYLDPDVTDAAARAKLNAAARVSIVGLGRDVPPPPIDAISVFRDDLAERPVLSTDHIGEVEIRLLGPLPSGG
jgi:mannosyltransferase